VSLRFFALLAGSPAHAECDAECLWLMLKGMGLDVCSRPIAQLNVEQLDRCQLGRNELALYRALQDPEFRRQLDEKNKADEDARRNAEEEAAEAARKRAAEEEARGQAAARAGLRRE